MANTYKIIGTSMLLILIRHGATRFDYSVMLSPSSQALDGYRSKLSRNFQISDKDIHLFLSRYIDYTFPEKLPTAAYRGYLTKDLDITSSVSNCGSFGIGRLGNQMCNIASQYGLYKKYGLGSFLSNYSYTLLKETFQLEQDHPNGRMIFFRQIAMNDMAPNKLNWIYISNEDLIYRRENVLIPYISSWFIKLEPNVCDFKGFLPYIKNLRENLFRFNRHVISTARAAVKHIIDKSRVLKIKVTFVSIHVRLTDMERHTKIKYNISIPPKSYFTTAMTYVEKQLGSGVTFLAFTDDTERAKEILQSKENQNFKIIFPRTKDYYLESSVVLAMLSLASGSILTHGTFGVWGALLRNHHGIIVAPKEFSKTNIGFWISEANFKGMTYM